MTMKVGEWLATGFVVLGLAELVFRANMLSAIVLVLSGLVFAVLSVSNTYEKCNRCGNKHGT